MPEKLGNGGHSQENYDPKTGRYIKENEQVGSNDDEFEDVNLDDMPYDAKFDNLEVNLDDMPYDAKFDNITVDEDKPENPLDKLFNKKEKETTHEECAKEVNPNYHTTDGKAYHYNCQRCIATYAMQVLGYDVEAKPYWEGDTWCANYNWLHFWKNLSLSDAIGVKPASTYNGVSLTWGPDKLDAGIKNEVSQYPAGAMFILQIKWSTYQGHVLIAEMTENGPRIVDPQSGNYYPSDSVAYCYGAQVSTAKLFRIDNKQINDKHIIHACVNKKKGK